MFAAPLPPASLVELPSEQALAKLVGDRSIDALLVVEAQPVRWLADLPPDVASSLRVLQADPGHATTARAIEDYLPARVRAANYRWLDGDVPTFATMAFLVVDPALGDAERNMAAALAAELCDRLPKLRASGHPKWREVQPGFRIEGGWSLWPPAQSAFEACSRGTGAVPTTMTSRGAAR
jgi:hypothetical protein